MAFTWFAINLIILCFVVVTFRYKTSKKYNPAYPP